MSFDSRYIQQANEPFLGQQTVKGTPVGAKEDVHAFRQNQDFFGQQYVNKTGLPVQLKVAEKRCCHSSKVTDASGQEQLFNFKAKSWTMSNRRILYDAQNKALATLRQKKFSHRKELWTVNFGESDVEVCTIKQDYKGSCAYIFLPGTQNLDASAAAFNASMRNKGRDAQIYTAHNQLLAESIRKNTWKDSMMGSDKYDVEIQPGVDQAFILCILTVLDDIAWTASQYLSKHPPTS